ncbi:hypothetical protein [Anaeromyxobacter diazotrophicus]|uniref:Outer membrane protein beta-barrel domain-containing protein n=1 Tax=Anaeromyxobacter diazotrophicus TaxID=2590199 RepID=A0A7I9VI23_9BACT|nr:hypothetical protein [Anaeromyxobacter diazotrophicus]GEJ56051.1 hypothetical protein AMYX_07920 [Anaeromyxobacter diazotrophicus]
MAHIRSLLRAAACAASLAAGAAHADDLAAAPPAPALPALPGPASFDPAAPAPTSPAAPAVALGRRRHILGLQLDGGVPDGAAATVIYRPLNFLRLGGGLLYNSAGYGVRGGVTVAPYFPIAPSLTLEAGHYFNANAASAVARYTHVSDAVRPLLQDVGYTFAEASIGLELGHPDWFVFFVRGGLSHVWTSVKNANAAAQQITSGSAKVTYFGDPNVELNIPDVKVGFLFFFY